MISTSFFSRRQVTRTVPPGGENERALSIRLSITWPSRESWPGTRNACGAPPSKVSVTVTPSSLPDLVGDVHQRVEQLREIDRPRFLALQFGVEAARVGDVGDQPVEPLARRAR